MYYRLATLLFGLLHSVNVFSQAPAIQFQHAMGGSLDDISYDVVVTQDGGYLVAGGSTSSDGDLLKPSEVQHGGNYDFWFAKLDPALNFQWKKHLGGTGSDLASSCLQAPDGGYFIGGSTSSNDVDVSGNHSDDFDFWIVKLFSSGSVQWKKCFGGINYDDFGGMRITPDGGLILAGGSQSNDGDVTGNHGSSDFWLVKTDGSGNIQWQKSYGGIDYEKAADVRVCPDGGYILVGFSESNTGDVTGNHGDYDVWVMKTDVSGNLQWQRSIGGSGYDAANGVVALNDGGFIVCGYSGSNDGDVTGNHGDDDACIFKLDESGTILWSKCMGGLNTDVATGVEAVGDDGFIFSCYSKSTGGDVENNYGLWDYWIVKTDLDGVIQWQNNFGGSLNDVCYAAKPTPDEGFILTGYSESQDVDVSGNHGKKDFWVVKLAGLVGIAETVPAEVKLSVYPQPADNFAFLQIPQDAILNYPQLSIDFFDLAGKKINEQTVTYDPVIKLDCSRWNSGIYFYRLKNNGYTLANGKIVVQ
ncbi:MAG: T9SS type A sorting domain-containing protein [Chitinophagaceae bacterium]|nr:T9SS type A sorting domain-containing protein [Chitinophagaceae bacterium]